MQVDVNASYAARVKQALADENLRIALDRATSRLSGKRAQAMAVVDAVRIRHEARAIRETAVANLPSLLQELETNLTANGCHVHWAVDAAEAQEIVRDIARHHGRPGSKSSRPIWASISSSSPMNHRVTSRHLWCICAPKTLASCFSANWGWSLRPTRRRCVLLPVGV